MNTHILIPIKIIEARIENFIKDVRKFNGGTEDYIKASSQLNELHHLKMCSKQISLNEEENWSDFAKNNISAHEVFDDMNDHLKQIHTFYAEECPKDESGMVLSLHDAEKLAYEYARRVLISLNKTKK